MKASITDFKTGWFGVSISLTDKNLEDMISYLKKLKSGEIDHFHIMQLEWKEEKGGLADLEISKYLGNENSTMDISV